MFIISDKTFTLVILAFDKPTCQVLPISFADTPYLVSYWFNYI